MKILPIYCALILLILSGCNKEQTDAALLELDKQQLAANINYDKIFFYKFVKIAVKASAVQDTLNDEYQKFGRHLKTTVKCLSKVDSGQKEISVTDAFSMYKDYLAVRSYIKQTDEDSFPTFIEGIQAINGDQKTITPLLIGDKKIEVQNMEHAALSMIVLATRDLGQPFALYECAKTQPELLPDTEIKTLLEFVRGFLFFSNRLYYLSEDGFSRNIQWLDKNETVPMPYTKAFFGWSHLNDTQTHTSFHSLNYLFRGFDRLMMERKIDQERALEDFEKFLLDTKKQGIENELTLSVEIYLNLQKGDKEKTINELNRLNKSALLSDSEHEALEKTIVYVNEREPEQALNGVYDKLFLTRIATKYMLSVITKIDWEKIMKENKIAHTDQIFATIHQAEKISKSVKSYTDGKAIEKGKARLKAKGSELLDGAKNLFK
jgi:hypothetical protein